MKTTLSSIPSAVVALRWLLQVSQIVILSASTSHATQFRSARRRLANPVKSDSDLLNSGRDANESADKEALALLKGLDVVPVHRNKGIDAFLRGDIDGRLVPIRVQRLNETIPEAAAQLYKAAKSKGAPLMFLIAIQQGSYFSFVEDLPSEIRVIQGPALAVTKSFEEFKLSNREMNSHGNTDDLIP